MKHLYSFLIACYGIFIHAAAFLNPKARLWLKGRSDQQSALREPLQSPASGQLRKVVWFHCASLGEFEQGRPVIEAFREARPDYFILLTFFSPSGYEIRKNYAGADRILYLPLDLPGNARNFIRMANPDIVFFIKYEFWFNYLSQLQEKKIPIILISARFRPGQYFFKSYGKWAARVLSRFTAIFVQDKASQELLQTAGIRHALVGGDTRFDRVAAIADEAAVIPLAEAFATGNRVLVAGSTWPEDEDLIFGLMKREIPDFRLIIAPHEIHPDHIRKLIEKSGGQAIRFSEARLETVAQARILVIDSVGMLSKLYRYGTLTYVGGGFGAGIHNTLEAAVYAKPVFFGPNYQNFNEALDLIRLGAAFCVTDTETLTAQVLNLLRNPALLSKTSTVSRDYVLAGCGATTRIMTAVDTLLK
jgi:3-deoxy-D-manno-octulosonic-acid transferase